MLVGAALSGCGTAAVVPVVPPADGLVLGLGANTLEGGLGHEQDAVLELGVTHLREELGWPTVEPRRGQFDWAQFDAMMAAAARRSMTVLPTIDQTPPWLAKDPNTLPPPGEWARFVATVVSRYGPHGSFWRVHPELDDSLAPRWFELWNEPYYEFFSRGGPDPARFAAMQRAAVTAGRAADPEARFLMPGETTYTTRDGTTSDWIGDLFRADPRLEDVFDGVVSHPYGTGPPTHTDGDRRTQSLRLDDLLAELDRHGAHDRPVWVTEIGWPTCRVRPACTNEAGQANDLASFIHLADTRWRDRVAAVYVYHLHDFQPGDPDDPQQHFGLLRLDGTRKPSWFAIRRAAGGGR